MSKWSVIRDKDGNAITLECDGEPVLHIYTTMLANQRADEIARWLNDYERLRAALVEIKQLLNEDRENDGAFKSWNNMQAWKVATQALSTTNDKKDDLWWMLECPKSEPCYCKEECVYSKKYRRNRTMTRNEVLALKLGRELDSLIAEKVMGWRKRLSNGFEYWDGEGDKPWVDNWSPSADIAAAWEVLEKFFWVQVTANPPHIWKATVITSPANGSVTATAKGFTAPEAICKAALLAVMNGEDEHERN